MLPRPTLSMVTDRLTSQKYKTMAKFAGSVGYVTEQETPLKSGVWLPTANIRRMQGDVLRTASTFQGTDKVNRDVTLQHRISLVGDAYAFEHFYEIRWVEYMGTKWEVTLMEVQRPRIIVTLGGIWNG